MTRTLADSAVDEPASDAPSASLESLPGADKKDSPAKEESEPEPAETVTVTNGRRRGRRRIMKKKTVKDEEGYLGSSCILKLVAPLR